MDRTYPRELSITDDEYNIIERIRNRIGDSIVFNREYMTASDSLTNSKLVAGGKTYYNPSIQFWPYNIKVNTTTYSGTVYSGGINPSVYRYQYLEFSFETFKLPDRVIWDTYDNATVIGLLKDPDDETDYMKFLKACIDLCKILRTKRIRDDYSNIEVVDGDTRYTKQGRTGTADPYKDLYMNIEDELNRLIDMANRNSIYMDGIRVE